MCKPFDEKLIYTSEYAALSANSKGRVKALEPDSYRTEYQRDIHRIIYCQSFRRLRHKTQVFFMPNNDHICTRMEHVLHVSSASRTVARHLRLNEDLVEAIGLGHDLGHAPFGHHGEHVLNDISKQAGLNQSFQHEMHGLRVIDKLAELDREPSAGLNLTYEVRDGIVSHCGEDFKSNTLKPFEGDKNLSKIVDKKTCGMPLTYEGCIVRIVDRIAYAGRDVEDAIVAGLIDDKAIPKDIVKALGRNNGEIIGTLLVDLIEYSKKNEGEIGLSKEKHEPLQALIHWNYENIYTCARTDKYKKQATLALQELFFRLVSDLERTDRLTAGVKELPEATIYDVLATFIEKVGYTPEDKNELIVLDFISGMTDNYVLKCLDEVFVPKCIT
ncbi:metal-dependent phosphohydrolase, HD sub domain [Geotalea uraniireducens Rf4]|uniref:Metal-dependent phosphohydrolase, HD sub domain n=2 Tax=Geotalea uraniireducens TaxID=351604 RepID=A5GD77_GEOUR|nr:metal-dependent phosphohydrolase, HD sub domain [Geotalea uraniireducens Rf4]